MPSYLTQIGYYICPICTVKHPAIHQVDSRIAGYVNKDRCLSSRLCPRHAKEYRLNNDGSIFKRNQNEY